MALLLVLGASAVMLLIGSMVSSQIRQGLRLSEAEQEAAEVQAVVMQAFREAAVQALSDPTWPAADVVECEPVSPFSGSGFPKRCLKVSTRKTVGTRVEIPIEVVWQVSVDSPKSSTQGWLILSTSNQLQNILYYHRWCQLPDNISERLCEP